MPHNFGTRRRRIPRVGPPEVQDPPPEGSVAFNARPSDVRDWLNNDELSTPITVLMDRDVLYEIGVGFPFFLNAEVIPRTATTTDQHGPREFNAVLDFMPAAGDVLHFPVGYLPAHTPSRGGASGDIELVNTDGVQPFPAEARVDFTNLALAVSTLDSLGNKTVFCLQGWIAGMTIVAADGLHTHDIISGQPADADPANDNPVWHYQLGPARAAVGIAYTVHFPAAALRSYSFNIPSPAADFIATP